MPRRVISDKTYTVGLPTGSGPAVMPIPLSLPDQGDGQVEAWIGNFGSSNAYVMPGNVPLAQAQSQLSDDTVGMIDCLMALTSAGPVRRGFDITDIRSLTVFFETQNTSGQTEAVTVRVIVYE